MMRARRGVHGFRMDEEASEMEWCSPSNMRLINVRKDDSRGGDTRMINDKARKEFMWAKPN